MPYAMSVIVSRAIPEIDGFKPSHRKLLYTMYKMGLLTGGRTKSANIVGQTMRLNPHGDQAIYETMVRLAKGNESLLHPFVDSKGNFGKVYSRDMAYAASRYTEAKLAPICAELFRDLDCDAVDFVDNYDNTTKEPTLLPTTYPNVLVSANQGIAVGMASQICGFNLAEVCDTTIALLKNPDHDIASTLLAPDFPTGGQLVCDPAELAEIYRNDDDRHHEIADRHDRHDNIQAFHGGIFAQDNDRREHHQHHRGHDGRDGERIGKGRADRVADDLADTAPADKARNGKQHRDDGMTQLFAPLALGQHMDVVSWAAALTAIERVGLPVLLGQCGFHKGGGGPQQGRDPHPEHRTGTTGRHCRHHAHQIAHAYPGGRGDDERLKRGKAVPALVLFADSGDHIPEQPHGQQPGAQGEEHARREQQHRHQRNADAAAHRQGEQITPEQVVYRFDQMGHSEEPPVM